KVRISEIISKMIRRSILYWLIMCTSTCCLLEAQIPSYTQHRYTIEDGLPSNECHEVVQDNQGYIWTATDRGLSRFDGYGFKNYGLNEGLGDLSCLNLFVDHHQDIWVATLNKKIYKYDAKLDSIIPYAYNHLFDAKFQNEKIITDFCYSSEDSLYVVFDFKKLAIIPLDGELSIINLPENSYFQSKVIEDNILFFRSFKSSNLDPYFKFSNGIIPLIQTIMHNNTEVKAKYNNNYPGPFNKSFGGGIRNEANGYGMVSCPVISNCIIKNKYALYGGGIVNISQNLGLQKLIFIIPTYHTTMPLLTVVDFMIMPMKEELQQVQC
ncbi:MAG: hypothetical protein V3V14_01495, partial [Saprospiraceae bacterium]